VSVNAVDGISEKGDGYESFCPREIIGQKIENWTFQVTKKKKR
jgi:hypothetical protein